MKKEYLECLEQIIELEKTMIIQDKTMKSLQQEIENLGKSRQYTKPVKQNVTIQAVHRGNIGEGFDSEHTQMGAGIGALVLGLIGVIIRFTVDDPILWKIITGLLFGAVGYVIGMPVGWVLGAIYSLIKSAFAHAENDQAYENAKKQAQAQYEKALRAAETQYKNDLAKYEKDLADDAARVAMELSQKEILSDIHRQLEKKHEETRQVLTKFYDAADIYETYRNIIAMCHIVEYLKSGICTELTGPNGAFLVFKYEMYEKKKIEQLDTIISQLDQLHFDNIMLNNSLRQIGDRVSDLTGVVGEVKQAQMEAARRNEQMIGSLGGQIGSYAAQIKSQNSVIAYNTACAANELNQLKQLEYYRRLA